MRQKHNTIDIKHHKPLEQNRRNQVESTLSQKPASKQRYKIEESRYNHSTVPIRHQPL